jgi:hypothetical protein
VQVSRDVAGGGAGVAMTRSCDTSAAEVAKRWYAKARDEKAYIGSPLPDGLLVLLHDVVKGERARCRRAVRAQQVDVAVWARSLPHGDVEATRYNQALRDALDALRGLDRPVKR